MAQADLDARVVALAEEVRLPGIDIHDEGLPKTIGVAEGITHGCHGSVGSVSFLPLRRPAEDIAPALRWTRSRP